MSYEEKIKIYQSMIRNLEKELKHYEGTPYFEDEEFKIRERINMHKEELRLYSQAAKADEYEAKAKAFDEIFEKYEGVMKEVRNRKFKVTGDVTLLGLEVEKVIKKYESGEYDAKK